MEKRGIENKTLFITLSLIVLVVIVIGLFIFSAKQKEPESNSVSEQCKFACDSNQKISFCEVERDLPDKTKATCDTLSKQNKFNVEPCSSISCVKETLDTTCVSGLGSVWKTPTSEENCPAEGNKFVRKRIASDNAPVEGQICCYYYE